MGYTDVTIPQSCIDCQSSPRMVVCHHVSSHCPENLFFFFLPSISFKLYLNGDARFFHGVLQDPQQSWP